MNSLGKILLLCFAVGGFAAPATALELVRDGRSDYRIVIRPDAPRVTRYAAEELQNEIAKTTGAKLPVVHQAEGRSAIYLGPHPELPKRPEFDPAQYRDRERFRISELANGNLSIMGAECDLEPVSTLRGNFGLLFGVYEFIERFLGTRWYAPGDFGACIEPKKNVAVNGLPIDQTPHCWSRFYWPNYPIESGRRDSLVFNRRMRLYGLRVSIKSHSMMDMYFVYKDSRPEIFALEADGKTRRFGTLKNDGTTHPEGRWAKCPQFCLSNPDTAKAYCEFIDAFYQKRPEGKFWVSNPPDDHLIPVVLDDNFSVEPCYCEACQKALEPSRGVKGSKSKLVWRFIAQVAEYVKIHYPDKKVCTLAYEDYYKAPGFKLPDNVVVGLCVNPYIIYQGAEIYRKDFDETIREWSKCASEISIWHYFLPYDCIPYGMPHIMYQWFRDYPAVTGVYLELSDTGLYRGYMPLNAVHGRERVGSDLAQAHLNMYFAMRGAWGAPLDVDAELDRYYRLFYGPAGKAMKKFFDLQHARWERVKNVNDYRRSGYAKFSGQELYENIYAPQVIADLKKYLAEAEQAAPENSIYRKRLQWLRTSYLDAFFRNAEAYAAEKKASKQPILIARPVPPVIDGKLDDAFYRDLEEYRLLRIDAPLAPRFGTVFKMGLADGKLYLGIRGEDPDGASRRLQCAKQDDTMLWTDDSMELFICPASGDPEPVYHVIINLNDVVGDSRTGRPGTPADHSFRSGIVSKTVATDKDFTMELALPLQAFGIDCGKESAFRMNLCRNKMSGVGENRERSAWSCPYGSFWNLSSVPVVRIFPEGKTIETFRNGKHPLTVLLRPMPKGKPAPMVKDGVKFTRGPGGISLECTLTEKNNPLDYVNCTVHHLKNNPLTRKSCLEIRFRNPDPNVDHMVVYAFTQADGSKVSDYYRFCRNESFAGFEIRAVNLASGGYQANKRIKAGGKPFDPVKLDYVAVYSNLAKHDGKPAVWSLDYIRLTETPLKAE